MKRRGLSIAAAVLLASPTIGWSAAADTQQQSRPAGKTALAVKTMFVTSASGSGDLGSWPQAGGATGMAAGDAICQKLAGDAGLPAPGLYRAWLSTSTVDAYCHMFDLDARYADTCGQPSIPTAAGPWQRVDGKPFAGQLDPMLGYDPQTGARSDLVYMPPRIDEHGNVVHGQVWTGTGMSGTFESSSTTPTCKGWTSGTNPDLATFGNSDDTGSTWNNNLSKRDYCSEENHLYCFQIGVGAALPSYGASGRIAFVTDSMGDSDFGTWFFGSGQSGIAAADQICQREASLAGLRAPESFKAWLSDSGGDALARFQYDGAFVRTDGIPVANSLADLTDAYIRAPIAADAAGNFLVLDGAGQWNFAWTGTKFDGTADQLCDWGAGGANGEFGRFFAASGEWTASFQLPCADPNSPPAHLYCLQDLPLLFENGFETGDLQVWDATSP